MTGLTLRGLGVTLGGKRILNDINLTLKAGECVGLIGPNGAGKSTLMRAALGLISHDGESSLAALPADERARIAAWLPQMREIAWNLEVATVVGLGRTPYRRFSVPLSDQDQKAIDDAIKQSDIEAFSKRRIGELSGGEQARVLLARALAQTAPILFADEPVAALDPAHQIATMELFADYGRNSRMVVTALHDLGLAARWCTRLVLLDKGSIVADGIPSDVLTRDNLRSVYGIEAHIADEGADGLIVQPLRRISA